MMSRVAFAIAILALAPSCSDAVRASPLTRKTHAQPPVLCTPAPGITASDHPPMVWHATASLFRCFLRPKPVACAPGLHLCLNTLLFITPPAPLHTPAIFLAHLNSDFQHPLLPTLHLSCTPPAVHGAVQWSRAPPLPGSLLLRHRRPSQESRGQALLLLFPPRPHCRRVSNPCSSHASHTNANTHMHTDTRMRACMHAPD
jgi:hypothetical protein